MKSDNRTPRIPRIKVKSDNRTPIEAKILLNVKSNPVLKYIDQTFEIPAGFGWHGCTHSHICFHKESATTKYNELEKFIIKDCVSYDLFCVTAGANSGFTQYVLVVEDKYKKNHVATGPQLMYMHWVVNAEESNKILYYIKGFKVISLELMTETPNLLVGKYRPLRYGWATTQADRDEVQDLNTMNGFSTGLIYLPNHGAADESVIFIRKDKPEHSGWDLLFQALKNMKNGETIQHYAYVPCAGTLMTVKKVGDSYQTWPTETNPESDLQELSLVDIFGSLACGCTLHEKYLSILKEYFSNIKTDSFSKGDYYFNLLSMAGILLAIEVASEKGDAEMVQMLQSWVNLGMTDSDSRKVWLNSEKSSNYNRTYYWNGRTVAYQTYNSNVPRHIVMSFPE